MNSENPNFRNSSLPNAKAMNTINKMLTQKMGKCFHEVYKKEMVFFGEVHTCKCGEMWDEEECVPNPDFFDWEGFGKLLTWAKQQDWWRKYERDNLIMECEPDWGDGEYSFPQYLVNPEEFAVSLFRFFKENGDRR